MIIVAFAALVLTVLVQTILLRRAALAQQLFRAEAEMLRHDAELRLRSSTPHPPSSAATIKEGVDIKSNGPSAQFIPARRLEKARLNAGAFRIMPPP
jgi:hypothetical protein